eukprot:gene3108-5872_t
MGKGKTNAELNAEDGVELEEGSDYDSFPESDNESDGEEKPEGVIEESGGELASDADETKYYDMDLAGHDEGVALFTSHVHLQYHYFSVSSVLPNNAHLPISFIRIHAIKYQEKFHLSATLLTTKWFITHWFLAL